LGNAVSSPSGVWGGAVAEIELGAFRHKIWHLVETILMIFQKSN